jgi:hypothetical protein
LKICYFYTKIKRRDEMATTVTNLHREAGVEIMTVDTGRDIFRVCSVPGENWDGVKIPLKDGIEDKGNASLISGEQISYLRRQAV